MALYLARSQIDLASRGMLQPFFRAEHGGTGMVLPVLSRSRTQPSRAVIRLFTGQSLKWQRKHHPAT